MNDKTKMVDVNEPQGVEIRIRGDGKVVWVNVDGRCVFRCFKPGVLEVIDEREQIPNETVTAPDYQYLT